MAQNDKKICLTPYPRNCTSYDGGFWCAYLKCWYLQQIFSFFEKSNFSGFSKFINKCQKGILKSSPLSCVWFSKCVIFVCWVTFPVQNKGYFQLYYLWELFKMSKFGNGKIISNRKLAIIKFQFLKNKKSKLILKRYLKGGETFFMSSLDRVRIDSLHPNYRYFQTLASNGCVHEHQLHCLIFFPVKSDVEPVGKFES